MDLAPWAGGEVVLALVVTPGPAADTSGDWAGWGQPQVVDARLPALEALHPGARMVDEWLRAGLTAEDFLSYGKVAQRAGRDEEAGAWYERAIRLEPESEEPYRPLVETPRGDAIAVAYLDAGGREVLEKVKWLRPGDLYVNYRLWKEAQQAGDLTSAAAYSEMLTYFPLEAISPADERLLDYAAEVIPVLLDEGLWDRDKTLNVVSFLVWQHHGADGVAWLLEQLMERYPAEPEWPFYLAELYHRRGDLDRAETVYRHVLALDPNYAPAYLRIGMLYEARAEEETER